MPVKKATTAKKAPVKAATKAPAKAKVARGDAYACEVCGLAVTVDETCGCVDVCDIVCCGKPMKAQKPRARVKTAK
jgi:hypothetical protein